MPLIEGLGDEVTIVLGAVVILLVGLLAWFSTHTTDIPFFSVIIVELSQRASRNSSSANQDDQSHAGTETNEREQQITANVSDGLIGQPASLDDVMNNAIDDMNAALGLDHQLEDDDEEEEEEEEDGVDDEIGEDNSLQIPAPSPSQSVDESQLSAEETLRRRRLAFFDNSQTSEHVNQSVSDGSDTPAGGENSNIDSLPTTSSVVQQETSSSSHYQTGTTTDTGSTDPDSLQIRVRLKYLNDTQRLVLARPMDTIGVFRRTHFSEELSQHKLVRLIYNGQDLRNETSTLQACNIVDNSVLHCLITQNVHSEPHRNVDADDDVNLGNFMLPIFGLLLGALWYLRFHYKQYFNAISTLSLAGISFLFIFAAFTSWRTNNTGRHDDRHLD